MWCTRRAASAGGGMRSSAADFRAAPTTGRTARWRRPSPHHEKMPPGTTGRGARRADRSPARDGKKQAEAIPAFRGFRRRAPTPGFELSAGAVLQNVSLLPARFARISRLKVDVCRSIPEAMSARGAQNVARGVGIPVPFVQLAAGRRVDPAVAVFAAGRRLTENIKPEVLLDGVCQVVWCGRRLSGGRGYSFQDRASRAGGLWSGISDRPQACRSGDDEAAAVDV